MKKLVLVAALFMFVCGGASLASRGQGRPKPSIKRRSPNNSKHTAI